jgi:hypothetical protein
MPSNVELSDPYLLGLTSNGVEVRTADKVSRMVQLIDLPKATHMCQGNSIFVVSPSSCWVLQPVPVDVQVDSLVAMEDFAAASKLAVRRGRTVPSCAGKNEAGEARLSTEQIFSVTLILSFLPL